MRPVVCLQLPSVWQEPKKGRLHWDALLEEMQVSPGLLTAYSQLTHSCSYKGILYLSRAWKVFSAMAACSGEVQGQLVVVYCEGARALGAAYSCWPAAQPSRAALAVPAAAWSAAWSAVTYLAGCSGSKPALQTLRICCIPPLAAAPACCASLQPSAASVHTPHSLATPCPCPATTMPLPAPAPAPAPLATMAGQRVQQLTAPTYPPCPQWLAKEFSKERGWKIKQARKYAGAAQRSNMDVESRVLVRQREEEKALRKRASWIAKEVGGVGGV